MIGVIITIIVVICIIMIFSLINVASYGEFYVKHPVFSPKDKKNGDEE